MFAKVTPECKPDERGSQKRLKAGHGIVPHSKSGSEEDEECRGLMNNPRADKYIAI